MQQLPIGIQEFRKIREGNFAYIDKTQHIYNLAVNGGYYFLSRPRRFGKSLTVNTLAELFKGSKELFAGLWIENKWDWKSYDIKDFNTKKNLQKLSVRYDKHPSVEFKDEI
ncbi:MAG: AAA family ATPase, partial [Flammeovirgaceae bacterium]